MMIYQGMMFLLVYVNCEINQSINIHYAPFELGVEYDNGVFSLTFIILWTRVTHKMQHYI